MTTIPSLVEHDVTKLDNDRCGVRLVLPGENIQVAMTAPQAVELAMDIQRVLAQILDGPYTLPEHPTKTIGEASGRYVSLEEYERERAYHQALGRFAATYARIESILQSALQHYAGTSQAISRALFSGVRARLAGQHIRRICEITGVSQAALDDLSDYLNHLNEITTVRDAIFHHGAQSVGEGNAFVSDVLRVHDPKRARKFPISPAILESMRDDLRKIGLFLITRHTGGRALAPDQQARVDVVALAPWHYTPQQLPTHVRVPVLFESSELLRLY